MAIFLDRNSKSDTRLFLARDGGGHAALAVDQSQWRTDLTDNTTYLVDDDTRLALRSPREISVVATLDNNDTGFLINFGNVAGTTWIYRIEISGASGLVRFHHNNSTNLATLALPSLGASGRSYAIHWSTDYDVLAATYYSEMAVCDLATSTWVTTRVTHSQPQAPAAGDQLNVSGYGAGVTLFSGGLNNIDFVRLGCRWHTIVESREDWDTESSAPTVTGVQPVTELAPTSTSFYVENPSEDVADSLLVPGTFAGPIEHAASINAGAGRKRLYSPLLNIVVNDPPTLGDTYSPANFHRLVELGSNLRMTLSHLYGRPKPFGAQYARVWIHAQTWVEAGFPMGTTLAHYFQAISMSELPGKTPIDEPPGGSTAVFSSPTNHGSTGVGEWFDLGSMPLQGNPTYIAIAYGFGTGTGHDFLRSRIKAIKIECYEG